MGKKWPKSCVRAMYIAPSSNATCILNKVLHTDVKAKKIAQGQFWTVFFYQLRLIAVNEAYPIRFVAKVWVIAAKIILLEPSFLRVLKKNLTHATIQNKRFTSLWSGRYF